MRTDAWGGALAGAYRILAMSVSVSVSILRRLEQSTTLLSVVTSSSRMKLDAELATVAADWEGVQRKPSTICIPGSSARSWLYRGGSGAYGGRVVDVWVERTDRDELAMTSGCVW